MPSILERDARPISDLQTKTAELLAHVQQTGRPVLLKANGKTAAVLISPENFAEKLETELLSRMLAEGEAEIAAGKAIPIHEFLKTLPDAKEGFGMSDEIVRRGQRECLPDVLGKL